ncbi:MAG TPA: rhomboid family intramembrane serine protease [Williamwhitmania sp.]|nr:rhomboid family intramembrane serine protease [Williamwhitmania sp.]
MDNSPKRLLLSSVIPFMFIFSFFLIFILEQNGLFVGYKFGILPRDLHGAIGILTSPFIHASWSHLASNSIAFFVLLTGVFYFYKDLGIIVLVGCWLAGGALTWFYGREAYHVGASGVVYGLASFLFFSGLIRQNVRLLAVSLIVVLEYGGMVWGLLPIFPEISWEGHLFGGAAGFVLAFILRNKGPEFPRNVWLDDVDEGDADDMESPNMSDEDEKIEGEGKLTSHSFVDIAWVYLFLQVTS